MGIPSKDGVSDSQPVELECCWFLSGEGPSEMRLGKTPRLGSLLWWGEYSEFRRFEA